MRPYFAAWTFLLLLAASGGVSAESGAVGSAALRALNTDIVFHLSFDDGMLAADLSGGEAAPIEVEGEPRFHDGPFGQALVLGGDDGVRIQYAARDNLDLTAPGALSFWIAPLQWHARADVDERPYLRMFNYRGGRGGHFFIQRQGFRYVIREEDGTLSRRHDRFQVGFYSLPEWDNVIHSGYFSESWEALDWRFVVINWDRAGYTVSYNGAAPSRREFSRPLERADFPPGDDADRPRHFTFGYGGNEETTVLDAFTVYRRPLEASEIETLYEAYTREAGLAE